MRKDSGFSDSRSPMDSSGVQKSDRIQDSGASSALPRDAEIAPAASAASFGVRELAPALEPPASVGPRETRALEGGKRRQGAALQSAQGAASRREVCTDVTKLAPEWRDQVEQLIVDGLTFEDVEEILKEREGPRVTLHALEAYYQSNLDLQKRRIKHLIELVDELKNAMAHPTSTEAQLADATLFTGLLRLSRRHAQLTVKDAQSLRLQRENLLLRKRVLKMKLAEAVRRKSIAHQHYLFEEERRRKLILQNQQLEEILKKLRQDQTLPADVMGKIQEIYGIVKQPFIPPQLAERLPQE